MNQQANMILKTLLRLYLANYSRTGTIVVHVLTRDARLNYDLEGLWDRRSAGRNTHADTEGETQLFA